MKNEKKELARVEKRLREVIEARLERGDALVRMDYGFSDRRPGGVCLEDNGCYACVLGSVVVEELLSGRTIPRPVNPFRSGTHREAAAVILKIDTTRAHALESGFMGWGFPRVENLYPLWAALGRQLSADYYETDWA